MRDRQALGMQRMDADVIRAGVDVFGEPGPRDVDPAGRDDRAAFDWLSAEMLGGDAREMLFVALGNFLRAKAPRRAPNA